MVKKSALEHIKDFHKKNEDYDYSKELKKAARGHLSRKKEVGSL